MRQEAPTARAKRLPLFSKLWSVMRNPPQDGRVYQTDASLGHHRHPISRAPLVARVPADTQNHDLLVKVSTFANLTHCDPKEIAAIELALPFKGNWATLGSLDKIQLSQGPSLGAVGVVVETARRLGIEPALGRDFAGQLALWQVAARVLDQGSRLSAVRWAQVHAACAVLGLRRGFDENDLYANLGWLSEHQQGIEKRLFRKRCGSHPFSTT
jgi:hypothetical protein